MRSPKRLSAVAIALLVGCPPGAGDDSGDTSDTSPPVTETIGPDGGTLTSGGATLTIPAGALDEDVEIGFGTVDGPADLPEDLAAAGDVFAATPHGQVFATPVTVEIAYAGSDADLDLLALDGPADTTWEGVPGASFSVGIGTFQVDHFSFYVVTRPDLSMKVVGSIDLSGTQPDALAIGGNHDLMIYDLNAADGSSARMRFVSVNWDVGLGEYTTELDAADDLALLWDTGLRKGWMVQDPTHGLTYVLGVDGRTNNGNIHWERIGVHAIAGRDRVGFFIVNPDGDSRPLPRWISTTTSTASRSSLPAPSRTARPG